MSARCWQQGLELELHLANSSGDRREGETAFGAVGKSKYSMFKIDHYRRGEEQSAGKLTFLLQDD